MKPEVVAELVHEDARLDRAESACSRDLRRCPVPECNHEVVARELRDSRVERTFGAGVAEDRVVEDEPLRREDGRAVWARAFDESAEVSVARAGVRRAAELQVVEGRISD